jgi:hypothetical protein
MNPRIAAFAEDVGARLRDVADFNHDGKLDHKDVERVMRQTADELQHQAEERPWAVVIGACIATALLTFCIVKLFFCPVC